MTLRRRLGALLAALALGGALAPGARADDPGRWLLTGASSVSVAYWQGLTSDPADSRLYFVGVFEGLWLTTPSLAQTAGVPSAIPGTVQAAEGYNHIGDPTWDPGDGGRVLLPLECFVPGVGNTCGTGSLGVADPATLGFRYYVKLDPAEIAKAMWTESSPDGGLVWTSSEDDLLAYRTADVSEANQAPAGDVISAVRRLPGAVPPSGVTGAVFRGDDLLLAGEGGGIHQIWAVDPETGESRLEVEMEICGESEGLDVMRTLGGELHWLIAPFDPGCRLSFGPTSALLHFVPAPKHERFQVEISGVDLAGLPGEVTATVHATQDGRPLREARVSFAGAEARTDKHGVATVVADLTLPGRFRALVSRGQNYGISDLAGVGLAAANADVPVARTGAG